MTRPLVSCVMPTRNRYALAQEAIQFWMRQSYENRELVILDTSEDARLGDCVDGLHLPHATYRHTRDRLSIGAMRNALIRMAQGEIIIHWDDDDVSHPERIERQVADLSTHNVDATGYHSIVFVEPAKERAWRYNGELRYMVESSMCYWRAIGLRNPFPDISEGEGIDWATRGGMRVHAGDAGHMLVARIHGANTCCHRAMMPSIAIPWEEGNRVLQEVLCG